MIKIFFSIFAFIVLNPISHSVAANKASKVYLQTISPASLREQVETCNDALENDYDESTKQMGGFRGSNRQMGDSDQRSAQFEDLVDTRQMGTEPLRASRSQQMH